MCLNQLKTRWKQVLTNGVNKIRRCYEPTRYVCSCCARTSTLIPHKLRITSVSVFSLFAFASFRWNLTPNSMRLSKSFTEILWPNKITFRNFTLTLISLISYWVLNALLTRPPKTSPKNWSVYVVWSSSGSDGVVISTWFDSHKLNLNTSCNSRLERFETLNSISHHRNCCRQFLQGRKNCKFSVLHLAKMRVLLNCLENGFRLTLCIFVKILGRAWVRGGSWVWCGGVNINFQKCSASPIEKILSNGEIKIIWQF